MYCIHSLKHGDIIFKNPFLLEASKIFRRPCFSTREVLTYFFWSWYSNLQLLRQYLNGPPNKWYSRNYNGLLGRATACGSTNVRSSVLTGHEVAAGGRGDWWRGGGGSGALGSIARLCLSFLFLRPKFKLGTAYNNYSNFAEMLHISTPPFQGP